MQSELLLDQNGLSQAVLHHAVGVAFGAERSHETGPDS